MPYPTRKLQKNLKKDTFVPVGLRGLWKAIVKTWFYLFGQVYLNSTREVAWLGLYHKLQEGKNDFLN